ncbi:MAG: hypothetical protein TU35_002960, partial [Thermoproteus sp. AZ2]
MPFIPLPGYIATAAYAANAKGLLDVAMAAAVTALGAALGKVVVFLYGYGAGKIIAGEELKYAKQFFDRISKRGVDLAVFIFAASPLRR